MSTSWSQEHTLNGHEDTPVHAIINYPSRGVVYLDNVGAKRVMRIDEIEKFSDGTLEGILVGLERRKNEYTEERSRDYHHFPWHSHNIITSLLLIAVTNCYQTILFRRIIPHYEWIIIYQYRFL